MRPIKKYLLFFIPVSFVLLFLQYCRLRDYQRVYFPILNRYIDHDTTVTSLHYPRVHFLEEEDVRITSVIKTRIIENTDNQGKKPERHHQHPLSNQRNSGHFAQFVPYA